MAARKTHKTLENAATAHPFVLPSVSATPTVQTVLAVLSQGRVLDLCRLLGCEVRDLSGAKDRLVSKVSDHLGKRLPALLRELGRDELRAVYRRHGLDSSSRARGDLQALQLEAAGLDPRKRTGSTGRFYATDVHVMSMIRA